MPMLIQYLVKLSISLTIVWLFYQFVLRRLTFYNQNRWYLLGYSLLAFFIPFINITNILEKNEMASNGFVQFIPSVQQYTIALEDATHCPVPIWSTRYDKWDWIAFAIIAGTVVLLIRFAIRFLSFLRMQRRAKLIYDRKVRLYQVDENIIPFSFGNAVFINSDLHSEKELQEIIRHEFVHVKQKHTVDIIFAEVLSILNWYNPFAWLLRNAIRQNLEFIADNKALENGIDRKQYQYLLLKVIGNNQFSIAPKFNFSSLKKRIAMMNKLRSAKIHLVKFLFVLPLLAVLLLAFRSQWQQDNKTNPAEKKVNVAGLVVDAATNMPLAGVTVFCKENNITATTDEKGYYSMKIPYENKPLQFSLHASKEGYTPMKEQENWGNFYEEHVRSLYSNSYIFFGLDKAGKSNSGFSALSGTSKPSEEVNYEEALTQMQQMLENPGPYQEDFTDTIPNPEDVNEKGYIIDVVGTNSSGSIVVRDKNGKLVERIPYKKWKENEKSFEDKYGELPPPPPPPMPPDPPMPPQPIDLPDNVKKIDINNKKATVVLKDGTIEKYDLNKPEEKAKFEKKYGEVIPVPPPPPVKTVSQANPMLQEFLERNPEVSNVGWVYNNVRENIPVIIHMVRKDGKDESYRLDDPEDKAKAEKKYGELPIAAATFSETNIVQESNRSRISNNFVITDKKATLHLKDGTTEEYDLTNADQRRKFSERYGRTIFLKNGVTSVSSPTAEIVNTSGRTVIAPMNPFQWDNVVADGNGKVIGGDEEVLVTISKKTTKEQLDALVTQMKEKGFELKYDNIEYREGILVNISGTVKSKEGHCTFVATDFSKVVLAMVHYNYHSYFKVAVDENKKTVI